MAKLVKRFLCWGLSISCYFSAGSVCNCICCIHETVPCERRISVSSWSWLRIQN